jgi:murein DD-endopeptidase MepM/ murein hydrolase activator NlpD
MGFAAIIVALVLHSHGQSVQHARVDRPVWPAVGAITSPFGDDNGRWHPGIDIGSLRSLTVRAAQGGVVENVGTPAGFEGYGYIVEIKAGPYDELYAHLASWQVKVGQHVAGGAPIGIAGCTGYCTGTHLHFEVRYGNTAVSPLATVLRPLVTHLSDRAVETTRFAHIAARNSTRMLYAFAGLHYR